MAVPPLDTLHALITVGDWPRAYFAGLLFIIGRSLRHWIFQLGGVGLIPLGLLDSSVIPLPGSMDVVTILLSARGGRLWPYYALMATTGSVLGGFLTYRLARKGGKETLERKTSRGHMAKICRIFERWGFAAIAIPALLPPPVPMVPFVLAAGAMQYPLKKFLAALILARVVRYSILAALAAYYGRQLLGWMSHNALPVALAIVVLLGAATALAFLIRGRREEGRAAS
jgi:membrane protein YqaA with SNARE-associated domain